MSVQLKFDFGTVTALYTGSLWGIYRSFAMHGCECLEMVDDGANFD